MFLPFFFLGQLRYCLCIFLDEFCYRSNPIVLLTYNSSYYKNYISSFENFKYLAAIYTSEERHHQSGTASRVSLTRYADGHDQCRMVSTRNGRPGEKRHQPQERQAGLLCQELEQDLHHLPEKEIPDQLPSEGAEPGGRHCSATVWSTRGDVVLLHRDDDDHIGIAGGGGVGGVARVGADV